jgi:hypothetical protein
MSRKKRGEVASEGFLAMSTNRQGTVAVYNGHIRATAGGKEGVNNGGNAKRDARWCAGSEYDGKDRGGEKAGNPR